MSRRTKRDRSKEDPSDTIGILGPPVYQARKSVSLLGDTCVELELSGARQLRTYVLRTSWGEGLRYELPCRELRQRRTLGFPQLLVAGTGTKALRIMFNPVIFQRSQVELLNLLVTSKPGRTTATEPLYRNAPHCFVMCYLPMEHDVDLDEINAPYIATVRRSDDVTGAVIRISRKTRSLIDTSCRMHLWYCRMGKWMSLSRQSYFDKTGNGKLLIQVC